MSSRLFEEIREERGLAYAVYSAHTGVLRDAGALTIYAGDRPGTVDDVLDSIDAELDRLAATTASPPTSSTSPSGYLEGSLVLGLEDSGSRMARPRRLAHGARARAHVDEQLDRYRAVTLAATCGGSPLAVLTEDRGRSPAVGPMPSERCSPRFSRALAGRWAVRRSSRLAQ